MKTVIMNVLELETVITFGKYSGKLVSCILKSDPQYLWWIHINNIQNFIIMDKKILLLIKEQIANQREFYYDRLQDSESIY
jgi:hypothetical protein